jgi:predicted enzyme related to lactoylglutathione lyase
MSPRGSRFPRPTAPAPTPSTKPCSTPGSPANASAADELAVFPCAGKPDASGALVAHPQMAPSMTCTTVHLSVESVSAVLERRPGQGGKVPVPRTGLHDGPGVLARFRDSEGNRVGPWLPR